MIDDGDYVLATKYGDGDPGDQWSIGFYAGTDRRGRHYVVDHRGQNFRGNGFRRVKKISAERGDWMLDHAQDIQVSGLSVWHFARCSMKVESNE